MVEEWKLAYLAGIVDGEGTIWIHKKKPRGGEINFVYTLVLQVVNTDKKLIEWLKENFGGSARTHTKPKGNHREAWMWAVSIKPTYKLLKQMKPYLVIKQEQADLGIYFFEKLRWHSSPQRVPMWLIYKREECFQKMKALHH